MKTAIKRLLAVIVLAGILLSGCSTLQSEPEKKQYTATFLTLFDTVTTIVGLADSKEEFESQAQSLHDELIVYHQLFYIYH